MSIVAETLNRLQSARRKGNASESPLKLEPSSHTALPQHVSRKSRGRMTFWIVAVGVTLSLATIGFGMFWFGITMGPKTLTPPRPLPLPKALSNSVESPPPPHSLSATTDTPAPTSDLLNVVHNKTLPTQQPTKAKKSTASSVIGSSPLSKSDRPISQGLVPTVRTNLSDGQATSPKHLNHEQKQVPRRPTTTPPPTTTHGSLLLAESPPTLEEISIPSPSEGKFDGEVPRLDNEVVHVQKRLMPTASHSKVKSPFQPEERLAQGRSLVKQYQYLEAVETLEPLFVSLPEGWEPWFWMGTAQMGLGHYEEAIEAFREGLARDETIPQLWVQWAIVEHQRGRYSQSLDRLRQAELLAPALPEIQLNLAFTLESQGHTRSALEHYRQYLSLTDHNPLHLSTRKKVLDRILHLEQS